MPRPPGTAVWPLQNRFPKNGYLLENGILAKSAAKELQAALALYQSVSQLLRLCMDGPFDPETAPVRLNSALARLAGQPDLAATEAVLADYQSAIERLFTAMIGRDGIVTAGPSREQ